MKAGREYLEKGWIREKCIGSRNVSEGKIPEVKDLSDNKQKRYSRENYEPENEGMEKNQKK